MNLQDTVKALEAKDITLAIDIGVHSHCDLDSNCPIAIQLRRLITDTGIQAEELLEGYAEVTTTPAPVSCELPTFDANIHLSIAGRTFDLELNDVISANLRFEIDRRLREIDRLKAGVTTAAYGLYDAYLREIRRQRSAQSLPQLSFSTTDLLRAGCMITSSGRDYHIIFPSKYKPKYIVKRSVRYKLTDEDAIFLLQKIYIKFIISQDFRFLRADVLNDSGAKFRHYHGDSTHDCWGSVNLPIRWDGSLESLSRLATTLSMSLTTINRDSILDSSPSSWVHIDTLLARSTELGVEGVINTEPVLGEPQPTPTAQRTAGWGRRA